MTQEIELQVDWLNQVLTALDRMVASFSTPERAIAVIDTHVLLHYPPLTDIDWVAVTGETSLRLVVPIRVVNELDDKKGAYGKLGDRARTRIRLLESHVVGGSCEVRPGVDVEVVGPVDLDPDAARRPPIPVDTEIIDTWKRSMRTAVRTRSISSPETSPCGSAPIHAVSTPKRCRRN